MGYQVMQKLKYQEWKGKVAFFFFFLCVCIGVLGVEWVPGLGSFWFGLSWIWALIVGSLLQLEQFEACAEAACYRRSPC